MRTCHIVTLGFVLVFTLIPPSIAGWLDRLFGTDKYNVLIYTPSGQEIYVGKVKGISSCQATAAHAADQRAIPVNYVCCKTDGDRFCISKHK